MRLGVNLGYWGAGNDADNLALAREADKLGYAVAWAAEAYGSDAATVLSWIAAQTDQIDIGSAVFQIPGRTPANCAMTAATLDTLSGGRFRLGLGVSGPQVSEGWHGVKFDKPLARTREYTEIVRKALRREKLSYDGEFFTLPLPDGPGKALTLTVHPVRDYIPMYLAAIGPKNLELTGELFDGWLAIFFNPEFAPELLANIETGRAKVGKTLEGFDVVPTVPVVVMLSASALQVPSKLMQVSATRSASTQVIAPVEVIWMVSSSTPASVCCQMPTTASAPVLLLSLLSSSQEIKPNPNRALRPRAANSFQGVFMQDPRFIKH